MPVVPVVWYTGSVPAPGSAAWDTVPSPGPGNRLTPREYQARWLAEYDRQIALVDPDSERGGGCLPGGSIGALAHGYAYPGPPEMFATAPIEPAQLVGSRLRHRPGRVLHLQIRTPDGILRCPQSLLLSLRDEGVGQMPSSLQRTGCSY